MGPFDRITRDPGVMGGRAGIRGMRVTVGMIVGQIGAGVSIDDLLADYRPRRRRPPKTRHDRDERRLAARRGDQCS